MEHELNPPAPVTRDRAIEAKKTLRARLTEQGLAVRAIGLGVSDNRLFVKVNVADEATAEAIPKHVDEVPVETEIIDLPHIQPETD